MLDPQAALVHLMVMVAAADSDMTDRELMAIGNEVRHLPVFDGFDNNRLTDVAREVSDILQVADGLERSLSMIKSALPSSLLETAYFMACDIIAADGAASQEELRLLEMIRHTLEIDRLVASAIERGVRARHARLPAG